MVGRVGVVKRPRFWNPVAVVVRELDRDVSNIDPVFKTPINRKTRIQEHVYNAQVNLGRKAQDRKGRVETGDRPETRGWLVMRTLDLVPNSDLPKPQKGWKIVKLYAGTDQELHVDYLIEEVRHESPLRGRPLLLYVEFELNRERGRLPGS